MTTPQEPRPRPSRGSLGKRGYGAVEHTARQTGEVGRQSGGTHGEPPAGFYTDPADGEGQRFWDGTQWTEHEYDPDVQQRGVTVFAEGGTLETAEKNIKKYYKNNKDTVHRAAGGALVSDGIVGFGQDRRGIFNALVGVFIGLVFMGFPLYVFWSFGQATGGVESPVQTTAVVTTQLAYGDTGSCGVAFEFSVDGKRYEGKSGFGNGALCVYSEGDSIGVMYDANNPESSNLSSPGEEYVFIRYVLLGFAAMGLYVLVRSSWTTLVRLAQIVAGLVLIFKSRKKRTPEGGGTQ